MIVAKENLKILIKNYLNEQGESDAESGIDSASGVDNSLIDTATTSKVSISQAQKLAIRHTGKELPRTVPWNSSESKHLEYLRPDFRNKVKSILGSLKSLGFQPIIYTSFRDIVTQGGKAKSGKAGKGAKGFGYHVMYGPEGDPKGHIVAVDIVDKRWHWTSRGGAEYDGKSGKKLSQEHLDAWVFWMHLCKLAEAQGLFWGGRWNHFGSGKPPGKKRRGGKVLYDDGKWYKRDTDAGGAKPFLFGADQAHIQIKDVSKEKLKKLSAYGVMKKLGKIS